MDDAVSRVLAVTARRYPGPIANIPLHSRLRQFEAGGVNRLGFLEAEWRSQKVPFSPTLTIIQFLTSRIRM